MAADNAKKTQEFFDHWDEYHQLVQDLDTYRKVAGALRGEIRGRLLDVGNGGVFNYDVTEAREIVVVDIAEELVAKMECPPNVSFQWGDATKLPVEANSFDTVLLQLTIHHLAEYDLATTRRRIQEALKEAYRVLKPMGRLVIIESCLPRLWERAELALFPVFRWFLMRINHPIVLQWNWETLAQFCRDAGFDQVEQTRIPLGKWVIQLGRKWPTSLTPIRIYKFVAHKPAN